MGTGWLAWTCMMLAAGAPASGDDVVHINKRAFQIPIQLERPNEVSQLYLFVSKDQGRTWEIGATSTPKEKAFSYYASADGLLFFSIAVKNLKGQMDPPDIYKAPVGQKIQIDTVKPVARIVFADRMGDEVQVSWEVQEDHPDWTSWKLEYRVGDAPNGTWTALPINPSVRGNFRFRPYAPGSVTLRLVMRDLAGNEASDEKTIGNSGGHFDRAVISAGAVAPAPAMTGEPAPPAPVMPSNPPPSVPVPSPAPPEPVMAPVAQSSPPASVANPARAVESTSTSSTYGAYRGPLPALQIVNKDRVKLGFDVTKYGPSGLGSVDVYVTLNEGATWEKVPGELPVSLPAAPDAKGAIRGHVTVAMSREGIVYGFFLVVRSRAGLGKQPPRAGDPPHVRIELDVTQPKAQLIAPKPVEDRSDSLLLTWQADDRNLAANPITLEWAADASGQWTPIGDAQLPNTGKYVWTVPMNAPPQVYLRLTVRDTAGNVAVAQTKQPVLIDLNQPEVGNVGIER